MLTLHVQKLRVKWNTSYSECFTVTNGVKQGGVLSPVLFGVYIDILINKLRDSGFGCTVGSHYVGCLAYADDIVFLSPTKIGLHEMLKICQEYSSEYFLTFNAQKSQYILLNQSVAKDNHGILIGHQFLPRQNHVLHLGRPQDY